MKIVHVVNSLGRGGAENLVIGLVREMQLRGHTACIISLTNCIEYQDLISANNIEVHCLGNQGTIYSLGNLLRTTFRLRKVLSKLNPDVINTHIFLSDVLTRLVCGWHIPVVTTFHTNEPWWSSPLKARQKLKRWIESITARHLSKAFVAVSKMSSEGAVKFLSIKPALCMIVKNGVDLNQFQPTIQATPLPARVIQVARFYPEKCHEVCLKAFREVVASIPNAELWLVGDGPDIDKTKRLAATMGLAKNVQFLGLREDIHNLLGQCSLFWLTSRIEGLPISLLEAMATGLPPIVTAVGDMTNIIESGRNGYLLAPDDHTSFAEISCALLKSPEQYLSLSNAAAQTISQGYSIADTASNYLNIYHSVSKY